MGALKNKTYQFCQPAIPGEIDYNFADSCHFWSKPVPEIKIEDCGQNCECHDTEINCVGLDNFPEIIQHNQKISTKFTIQKSNIKHFHDGMFAMFVNLEHFVGTQLNLRFIAKGNYFKVNL